MYQNLVEKTFGERKVCPFCQNKEETRQSGNGIQLGIIVIWAKRKSARSMDPLFFKDTNGLDSALKL